MGQDDWQTYRQVIFFSIFSRPYLVINVLLQRQGRGVSFSREGYRAVFLSWGLERVRSALSTRRRSETQITSSVTWGTPLSTSSDILQISRGFETTAQVIEKILKSLKYCSLVVLWLEEWIRGALSDLSSDHCEIAVVYSRPNYAQIL